MAHSAVAVDPDQTLDVVLNLPSQITLYEVFAGKKGVQLSNLVFIQFFSAHVLIES